ncbi:MAG: uridine phosphorylase [Promethearchaeota archaeon]|nr:MAG: uridine phosphorylase [Candidatus Lokiarchaeota archaeon]
MEPKEFPILEFDTEKQSIINPERFFKGGNAPEICIFPFYKSVINDLVKQNVLQEIGCEKSLVTDPLPLYEMKHKGQSIAVVTPGLGAPFAAGMLEFAIGMGCKKFIVIGFCGLLDSSILPDNLIIPTSAILEEGTSYHYLLPSREVEINLSMQNCIKSYLDEKKIKYLEGKTWSTDAFYRETPDKIQLRRSEGALAVEMEAAALAAVASFRGVSLGYILGAGDDVSGLEWDHRNLMKSMSFHEKLFWLAADIAVTLWKLI